MDRLEYFKNLLEKSPDNPLLHYSLALEYYKLKDYENTIKHMERYMSLKEDEGAGYRVLAKCYEELGEYEKAIEILQERASSCRTEEVSINWGLLPPTFLKPS